MPKKSSKRVFKRRRFSRRVRKSRRNPTILVNRSLTPFAPNFRTKHKYAHSASLTLSAGVLNDYVFNLNSLFDPDQTGAGHQPMGRDQLAALYNRYRVFAISYRVTFTSNTNNQLSLGVLPTNSRTSNTGTALTTIMEQQRSLWKAIVPQGQMPILFKGHLKLPRLAGVTSSTYRSDDQYQALQNASPVSELALHVWGFCTTGDAVNLNIQIMYHCEWFDPYPLGAS